MKSNPLRFLYLNKYLLLAFFTSCSFLLSAQNINKVSASPNPATTNDLINIAVEGQLINYCWSVNGVRWQRNGFLINVYIDFEYNSFPFCTQVVRDFTETVSISPLPEGTYIIKAFREGYSNVSASTVLIVTSSSGGGGGGGSNSDCACTSSTADDICDDFESYTTSTRLGPQSPCWTTWTGSEGGLEDGLVGQSGSNKYLKMQGTSGGTRQNVVLQLGNRTSGVYELGFDLYNYPNSFVFYGLLNSYAPNGGQANSNIYLTQSGLGYVFGGNGYETFNYSLNQWNRFVHYIDLDRELARLYVNGSLVHEWAYSISSGSSQLGGANFTANSSSNRYNVDNVNFRAYDSNCIDIRNVRPDVYCTLEYVPVCGCDGREYSNACAAGNAGLKSWTNGPCGSECINPALITDVGECPLFIDWVCGCDGNTYFNECIAVANGVTDWTNGPCGSGCVNPTVIIDEGIYCPQVYAPVCGCNGEEYYNECQAAMSGVTNWVPGPCPCIDPNLIDLNAFCPLNIDYVCGCDGNTYVNECTAISRGVTDWTNGPCGGNCVVPNVIIGEGVYCPQVYDPVCGCDGQEYSNDCAAGLAGVISWVPGPCANESCGNDPFEPNETVARRIYTGAYNYPLLCPSGDYDWFYFYSSTSAPNVRVQMASLPADYELYLYDNNFNLLDRSERPGTSSEEVIYNTSAGNQRYFVLVEGYLNAWNGSDTYRLRADRSGGPFNFAGGSEVRSQSSDKQGVEQREVPRPNVEDAIGAIGLSNSPNPFSEATDIIVELPEAMEVSMRIADMQGRVVAQLMDGKLLEKGQHRIYFDGSTLAPGVYVCMLATPERQQLRKMVVN